MEKIKMEKIEKEKRKKSVEKALKFLAFWMVFLTFLAIIKKKNAKINNLKGQVKNQEDVISGFHTVIERAAFRHGKINRENK